MEPNGKFHLVLSPNVTHEEVARKLIGYTNNNASDLLYQRGWIRIIPYGSGEMVANGKRYTDSQLSELISIAIEEKDTRILFETSWTECKGDMD
jgi:rubrerythrin